MRVLCLAGSLALTACQSAAPCPDADELEMMAVERICVEATRRDPHQLSCDWGDVEGARAWLRQYEERLRGPVS